MMKLPNGQFQLITAPTANQTGATSRLIQADPDLVQQFQQQVIISRAQASGITALTQMSPATLRAPVIRQIAGGQRVGNVNI